MNNNQGKVHASVAARRGLASSLLYRQEYSGWQQCVVSFGFSPSFVPCQPVVCFHLSAQNFPQLGPGRPRMNLWMLTTKGTSKNTFSFCSAFEFSPIHCAYSPLSPNLQGRWCCPALPAGTVAVSELCSCCLNHFMGKIIPSCISFASCYATAFCVMCFATELCRVVA